MVIETFLEGLGRRRRRPPWGGRHAAGAL